MYSVDKQENKQQSSEKEKKKRKKRNWTIQMCDTSEVKR